MLAKFTIKSLVSAGKKLAKTKCPFFHTVSNYCKGSKQFLSFAVEHSKVQKLLKSGKVGSKENVGIENG